MLLLIYGVGLKLQKSPKQHPNPAIKPEKSREKVAETAEITKTAPKLSQKPHKNGLIDMY